MPPWLIFAGVGVALSLGLLVVLFAFWLEQYTRRYGECGGPPEERQRLPLTGRMR